MADSQSINMGIKACFENTTFTFVVGPEGEQRYFYLHPDTISKCSRPLGAMINNQHMEESLNRTAFLKEVDTDTFALFAEFAYTGNYRCGTSPGIATEGELGLSQELEITIESATPRSVTRATFSNTMSAGAYEKIKAHLLQEGVEGHCCKCSGNVDVAKSTSSLFCCLDCVKIRCTFGSVGRTRCFICSVVIERTTPLCSKCAEVVDEGLGKSKGWAKFKRQKLCLGTASHEMIQKWMENMIPADLPAGSLAAHAKLWVFAECYNIATLKQLSLFKLHRDLCVFQLGPKNTTAFVDTIDFVYSNTVVAGKREESTQVQCELREVVLAYAICYADALVDDEDFLALLQGGGDLAREFARAVTKRDLRSSKRFLQ